MVVISNNAHTQKKKNQNPIRGAVEKKNIENSFQPEEKSAKNGERNVLPGRFSYKDGGRPGPTELVVDKYFKPNKAIFSSYSVFDWTERHGVGLFISFIWEAQLYDVLADSRPRQIYTT